MPADVRGGRTGRRGGPEAGVSGRIRLLTVGDVPDLTELVRVNRQFLAPWSPLAEDASFTEEGQRAMVEDILDQHRRGMAFPMVIVDEPGPGPASGPGPGPGPASRRVVGRITLNGTMRHNVRSQRVLERNGFTRIGVAREYLKIAGSGRTTYCFSW